MNLIDFLRMGGQERRNMLDNYVDDLNLERFLPPNLRPAGQFVNEMNPVNAMGSAMQDATVAFDPNQTNAARLAAARDMGFEMAMTLAPAALVRMGYLTAPAGLAETFGMSVDNAAENARGLISDATYAARSVAEGDPRGVIEAFQRGGTPQSVGAAGIGDNGGPPLDVVPSRATLFSPSLRAAENLKQNKGTYEQLRGMLLKGGGKEAELEWSGMDRTFAGKKVTKEELINYLKSNDPRLTRQTRNAFGTIGDAELTAANFNFDDWFETNIVDDGPLMSEEINHYADFLSEDLTYQPDVTSGHDLDADELENLMERTGLDEEQLVDAEYIIDFGGDDVRLHNDAYDAVVDYYGEDGLREMVTESLRENFEYEYRDNPEAFFENRNVEVNDDFDAGETQYSDYFPYGAENYRENFFQYTDPSEQVSDEFIKGASHFGADDELTQYHTRVGDFDVLDGGRARYVGEIQSDAQQNIDNRARIPMDFDTAARLTDFDEATLEDRALKNALMNRIDNVAGQMFTIVDDLSERSNVLDDIFFNEKLRKTNRHFRLEGRPEYDPNNLSELDKQIINITELGKTEKRQLILDNINQVPVTEETQSLHDLYSQYKDSNKQYDILATKLNRQENELYDELPNLESKKRGGAGPMMASQNRWVDDALRRSIIDAVNDPSVDFLALPQDRTMIGKVGGNSDPKQGAVDFYNRDVQNRFRGILKKVDPDAKPETIRLKSDDVNFPAYGLRLTPEFRRSVMEKGLPTFAAFGAANLMGVFDYLKEQKEKRNERFGGLMGYGGL
jgi:hypothetical protein